MSSPLLFPMRFWIPTPASCPVAVSRKTIARPLRVGVSLSVHKKQPHRFNHGCGTRRGKSSGGNHLRHAAGAGSCPQCRLPFPRDGFRPNRQLANVVAAVQELAMPAAEELCRRHCQPFTLFCRRNGILLCATCAENRAHRAVPLEEAAREYREQFEASLKALQEEDERRARLAAAAEEMRQEMLTRVDAEKQKLLAVLEGLRRVLGEQESRFLIRLGRLRRGLEEQRRGEATELARLRQHRTELQTKCRQPDSDLLRDAQITLSRHLGVLAGGRLGGIPESNRDAGPSHSSPPNPSVSRRPDRGTPGIAPGSSSLGSRAFRVSPLRFGSAGLHGGSAPLGCGDQQAQSWLFSTGGEKSASFHLKAPHQPHVSGLDGRSLGVECAQPPFLQQSQQMRLAALLQSHHGSSMNPKTLLDDRETSHQPTKRGRRKQLLVFFLQATKLFPQRWSPGGTQARFGVRWGWRRRVLGSFFNTHRLLRPRHPAALFPPFPAPRLL
ncbi:uncharacterized protein LOC128137968 isoform X1 [Harpia harpyja]|uniref:uncharacterized protein LOC128137968 isoform X1 n=1 Tax=Harpia harpyja TaxID=202280 RepID=UPI0022B11F37|nr:uncharacterized protein LOC128137968 isoform X1 [Harpia harpyja]